MSALSKQALSFAQTGKFEGLFADYIANRAELLEFVPAFPNRASLVEQASQRTFSSEQRSLLVERLRAQYGSMLLGPKVEASLQALAQEDCLTITTGHQPVLLGGPLFSIYKIITTIQLARQLAEESGKPVVPIFWMATEDHDFEEIQSVQVFGKKVTWDSPQGGAVGRFPTSGIAPLLQAIGLENEAKLYEENGDLASATRSLMHQWFQEEGLVVLDGDDPYLKATFVERMLEELQLQKAAIAIQKSNDRLTSLGYKVQAHARPINLFWLGEHSRERIVPSDEGYSIGEAAFTSEEMEAMARSKPECLSPNALLRPLYQEWLLPNVAYVGGPGEIAYWLQLKPVFEAFEVTMPLVWPRLHGQLLSEVQEQKRLKFDLAYADMFKPFHQLKKELLPKVEGHLPNQESYDSQMEQLLADWKSDWLTLDKSWNEALSADMHRQFKAWQDLGHKYLKKAEKRNQEYWTQIEHWLEKIFPEGNLQERKENLLTFMHQHPQLVQDILAITDPFDFSFNLFTYADEK
jgi:bacillithiol biosynthesis cysteine-adding enzyme BshC